MLIFQKTALQPLDNPKPTDSSHLRAYQVSPQKRRDESGSTENWGLENWIHRPVLPKEMQTKVAYDPTFSITTFISSTSEFDSVEMLKYRKCYSNVLSTEINGLQQYHLSRHTSTIYFIMLTFFDTENSKVSISLVFKQHASNKKPPQGYLVGRPTWTPHRSSGRCS